MITITVTVDELDYGALARKLLPIAKDKLSYGDKKMLKLLVNMAAAKDGRMAEKFVDLFPEDKLDSLAAKLINYGEEKIIETAQKAARSNGVDTKIRDIRAVAFKSEDYL